LGHGHPFHIHANPQADQKADAQGKKSQAEDPAAGNRLLTIKKKLN